jgi:DNA modification methylase
MERMTPYYSEHGITLFHGDCRDILPSIQDGLVVTDPPYNRDYHYRQFKDRQSEEAYLSCLETACRLPAVIIHYHEDVFSFALRLQQTPARIVPWVYNSNTPRQSRSIAWFGVSPDFALCGQPYKNKTDRRVQALMDQGREARLYDWWNVDQVKNVSAEKTEHPCQIPELVMSRILTITPEPALVIDPFCGSGTTLVSAQRLGREVIGIEVDESYCELAAKRLSQRVLF